MYRQLFEEERGVEAILYRVTDPYPDPMGFDLVVIGAPIYYERPMETVIEFIDEHNGLPGSKIAVFITCLAASKKDTITDKKNSCRRVLEAPYRAFERRDNSIKSL